MQMEIMASRMLAHRAAWMADHHLDNVAEASMAKAHGARTAQNVTTRAMVLLGETGRVTRNEGAFVPSDPAASHATKTS